jgi:LacI family transcriptional regulator, repressor for deo operon, udp, cdd, tsx, nupC, and nupG
MNSPGAPASGRTVTLQDVAAEVEVAVSTVSRALSNPDRVSRPMRERIQEAAKRLGYTSVRAPVRASLLALTVSGVANPHNSTLIRGVESQARAAGS